MKYKLLIIGMSCASCQATITSHISKLKGVKFCDVSLFNNTMQIDIDENILSIDKIINEINLLGFNAKKFVKNNKDLTFKIGLIKTIINFILLLPIMYFSMGPMLGIMFYPLNTLKNTWILVLIQIILCIPVFINNFNIFKNGFRNILKLHPNMNSLVSIGCSASFSYGIYSFINILINTINYNHDNLIHFSHNIYFESFAMILTFVSFGKLIENASKTNASKSLKELSSFIPNNAKLFKDGKEININVNDIKENDLIICKKGDIIPLDGTIIDGNINVDQSNFTGESFPVSKNKDDHVISGTIVTNGYAVISCSTNAKNSSFNKLIESIENSSSSKPKITRITDKIALYFVPIIFVIAILSFTLTLLISKNIELALNFSISVLVVACPCALVLATPIAIMVGTTTSSKNGILIKSGEILEQNGNIKCVVFDKTGTLTLGKPVVTDFINIHNDPDILNIIYSLEIYSNHPLANAICDYSLKENAEYVDIDDFSELEGKGIKGTYNNDEYLLGNIKLSNFDNSKYLYLANNGKTILYLFKNKEICAVLALKDELKEGAKETIELLNKNKIKTILLTGDNNKTAEIIAKELCISDFYSEVLPKDKAKIIKEIKNKYGPTAMVGDGVNDALALIESDVGIAIGHGSDIAIDKGDIVLFRNNILDVFNSIKISKKIMNTIKFNIFWALFYNSICVLIASGALYFINGLKITPMIASILMSISSFFVVSNSLTIRLFKPYKMRTENIILNGDIILLIEGMMCDHCVNEVTSKLNEFKQITNVKVILSENKAYFHTEILELNKIVDAINSIGFKAKLIKESN